MQLLEGNMLKFVILFFLILKVIYYRKFGGYRKFEEESFKIIPNPPIFSPPLYAMEQTIQI